ncbi:catalase family peroxidase [Paraburkholderia phymatum]|uniref:catalase family peroxidase n=1 Tax=Paraburkholderia phymatum TaxID=148447 RepID=UPI0031767D7C
MNAQGGNTVGSQQDQPGAATPAAVVDALKAVAGNPKGVRASFAKGICVRGRYTPSEDVSQVTKSVSFNKPARVLARVSVGGGNPAVADTNKLVLRGFSFRLENDGPFTDVLTESAPVHFAKNLDQMLAFLKARIPGPDGKPDAEKVKAFSAANPETLNQASHVAARPLPGSFAGTTYWGVHAFPATNAAGQTRFIKFKIVPAEGEVTLSDDEAKDRSADFLRADLEQRIAAGKARFHVLALLDRPGDPTMDVTQRWPDEDDREAMRLGTIEVTSIDASESCDSTVFDPSHLAEGIGFPPDEIFAARSNAYGISFSKRHEADKDLGARTS